MDPGGRSKAKSETFIGRILPAEAQLDFQCMRARERTVLGLYVLLALLSVPVFPHFLSPNEFTRWAFDRTSSMGTTTSRHGGAGAVSGVPGLFVCHGAVPFEEEPLPLHPRLFAIPWRSTRPVPRADRGGRVPGGRTLTDRPNFRRPRALSASGAAPERPARALVFTTTRRGRRPAAIRLGVSRGGDCA